MYDVFKKIQSDAEMLGTITEVKIFNNDKYWGNSIHITGVDESGNEFELDVTRKVKVSGDDRN